MGQLPREAKATNNIQQHKKEAKNGQGKGEKRGTPKEAQKATEEKKAGNKKQGIGNTAKRDEKKQLTKPRSKAANQQDRS